MMLMSLFARPNSIQKRLVTSGIYQFRKICNFTTSSAERPPSIPIAEETLPHSCSQDDIANALREHFRWQTPVLLRNAVKDAEACRRWSNLEYLKLAVGENTICDVEIGSSYNDDSVQKPRIPFESYIDYIRMFEEKYNEEDLRPKPEEMIYCAQNILFEGLQKDFEIPFLCCDDSYGIGHGKLYQVMIWFGPRFSMSPLHYDLLDNLILQFVGQKKVLLYPQTPDDHDDWYYAGEDGQQYNTSPIDVEQPDLTKYPRFQCSPPALEAHLKEGDVLFIPKKWWHHVKNLERSLSVNVFWR